jgi:hypothetical protein
LDRVRKKLGNIDKEEAKRLSQILGGEVGTERSEEPKPIRRKSPPIQREKGVADSRSRKPPRPQREVSQKVSKSADSRKKPSSGADDPSVPIKLSYRERVKMDRYAGNSEFEVKSFFQVLYSIMSIFNDIPDWVNPKFVTRRMNDYYKKIETLVTATRVLFPRNNKRRGDQLKRLSPFTFTILETIRYWNIEQIASNLAGIQAHPRRVLAAEFADILRAIYKPLFLLEQLEMESHFKEAYKILYKILYLENPMDAKRYQEFIRISLSALVSVRHEVQFNLYPLLLKLLSDRFLPYEQFFIERRNRFMAFIGAQEEDRISPASADFENILADPEGVDGEGAEGENEDTEEKKGKHPVAGPENKAVERGLQTLELLFPKAGWENISSFPDFYPYFSDVFSLKNNYALIAPTDPLQQVMVLTRILEELFFGLRFIKFGPVHGSDGNYEKLDDLMGTILNQWNSYVEISFDTEYLPRLAEYCRILDSTVESKTSSYAKRLLDELHWIKRLYFFPYYKFESFYPPPFKKNEIGALYPEIRHLRKYLTAVAAGIEQGNKLGGVEKKVSCDGIDNPWDSYVFQVSNPVSTRLDALLKSAKQKNNASLIFFALAVTTVLDYIVNNENSWAYANRPGPLFRSAKGEGITPAYGVDNTVDTTTIFTESINAREQAKGAD